MRFFWDKQIIILVLLGVLTSCDNKTVFVEPDDTIPVDELEPRKDIPLTRAQAEYAQKGSNIFALNLFKEVAKEDNLILSPIGVTFALGMIDNGASRGTKTKEEIERVLGYEEDSIDGLNSFCKTMLTYFPIIDPSTTISFANCAVVNSAGDYPPLNEQFENEVNANYSAELFSMEFGKDDVRGYINTWSSRNTNGMIPELLKEQPRTNEYAHFLNALYFKGIWSRQFKKADSRQELFRNILDQNVKVNMMNQEAHFNYGEIENLCSAVCLPFGNQAYRMLFVLPIRGLTLSDLRKSLSLEKWDELISSLHDEKVNVKIPSFDIECGLALKDNIQHLGMVEAFDPLNAHFELMCESPVWVDNVLHRAKIKVDEQGSEAAAVTDVVMGKYGMSLGGIAQDRIDFHADRPFLYAITEVSTGAIFFIGQYTGK